MTTLMTELDHRMEQERPAFVVVHPLDDVPEVKLETEHLGPMPMTRTVKVCLYVLRGHLLLMFGLLGFRVLQLAGVIEV
jgi:hypothetical protein